MNILFSGDFVPLVPKGFTYFSFESMKSIIRECDFHISNLECPITVSEKKITKIGPHLKTDISALEVIKSAGTTHLCLANNHSLDYSDEGVDETLNLLEKNGIGATGVNKIGEEFNYLILEKHGRRIAVINFCESEFSVKSTGVYSANNYDPINAYHFITRLRKDFDHLIVVYHGGHEYWKLPNPEMKRNFHYLVDIGADAIICHHSHVISGYELYNSKPIIYGLGNFFFHYENEPMDWHYGLICLIQFDEKIKFQLIPISQCYKSLEVVLLQEDEKRVIEEEVEMLSEIISSDDMLAEKWQQFTEQGIESVIKKLLNLSNVQKIMLKLSLFEGKILRRDRITELYNLIRCDSHRTLLIDSMKKFLNL